MRRLAFVIAFALPAILSAGNFPILVNKLDIGTWRSLPLVELSGPDIQTYAALDLVGDTEALLTADVPIIVRMETLRRAVVFAMYHEDVAKALLARLIERAVESKKRRAPDALAFFDAGYTRELLREADFITGLRTAGPLDSDAWINVAIGLRGDDPQLDFAAARLAYSRRINDRDLPAPVAHERKAHAAAAKDPLIARNLRFINARAGEY